MLLKFITVFTSRLTAGQYRKPWGIHGKIISSRMEKRNRKTYNWVMPFIKTAPGDRVLEIGYGAGTGIKALAERGQGISIYGIDFSKVMYKKALRAASKLNGGKHISLSCGDLLNYNIEQKGFNIIFGINVLYFWKTPDVYFSKIYDLLSPGGKLYLYAAGPERLLNLPITHNNIFSKYTLEEITGAMAASGFKNIRHETHETDLGKAWLLSAVR
jgi:SAM-dependent methyltransferase